MIAIVLNNQEWGSFMVVLTVGALQVEVGAFERETNAIGDKR